MAGEEEEGEEEGADTGVVVMAAPEEDLRFLRGRTPPVAISSRAFSRRARSAPLASYCVCIYERGLDP